MKILFLTRRFYPEVGGVEKHVLEISKRFVKRGHEVKIITELGPNNQHSKKNDYQSIGQSDTQSINSKQPVKSIQSEHFELGPVKVFRFKFGKDNWFKKFRIWATLFRNLNLITDADVVHCHDVFFWYLPFRFLFPGKKVFTTFHGYETYPLKFKNILIRKFSELLSYGTICVGDFMKKWYFAKPDFVIYGGVNKIKSSKLPPKADQPLAEKIKSFNKNNSALFIGRLDEQTNIREYCSAVSKIKKKIPHFKFEIAGDGKFRSHAARFGKVLGFIKNPEDNFAEYRFAFVSRYLSILEAMAAKKLVFAMYDNPIKEDYLRMTPFASSIIITDSPEDLADKINFYLKNSEEEQKAIKKSYSWVKDKSWEEVVNIYQKLWSKR